MFGLFSAKKSDEKKTQGVVTALFKIDGMHCVSCGLNIDGNLEDLVGVQSASTNYAKAETKVTYDPQLVSLTELRDAIARAGYAGAELQ